MARLIRTTAHVKGGMPVAVEGDMYSDGEVENIAVRWSNTGKPVTAKFEESLSPADWDAIIEAIAAEA